MAAALRAALAAGADRIELDVLRWRSGLVVAHDARGLRNLEALALDDALALLDGAGQVALLADLKHDDAADGLGAALAARGLGARTIVCGARLPALRAARAGGALAAWTLPALRSERPDGRAGPLGLATSRARARVCRAAAWAVRDGACAAVCVDRRFVDAALVDAVHAARGRLYAWTADDEGELRRLAALGVDGLVTNDPATARRVRAATLGVS